MTHGVPVHAVAPRAVRARVVSALVGPALLGVGPVYFALRLAPLSAPLWVALVWQVVALVYWAGLLGTRMPLLLARTSDSTSDSTADETGASGTRLRARSLVVAGAVVGHVALVVTLTAALHLGTRTLPLGAVASLAGRAALVYLPLDLLAVVGIMTAGALIERLRERALHARALADARERAIRAQLEPHFLYNALQVGAVLARRGDGREAARVLGKLGDLLRYVLSGSAAAEVTLREEMAFIERYLDIERIRFGDRLTFSLQLAPELASVRVPSLILQPLIENAVKHGLAERELPGGALRVCATREGDTIVIEVADNGRGEQTPAAPALPRITGIGLEATRERLALRYGPTATLSLVSSAAGTCARITLPNQCLHRESRRDSVR